MVNCENRFGERLMKALIGRHNILYFTSNESYIDKKNKVEYITGEQYLQTYQNDKLISLIKQSNNIVDHSNDLYGPINICVDCKNGNSNEINLSSLILNQTIINNAIKMNSDKCKIIYNNNFIIPSYINESYSEYIQAFNCDGKVQTAVDIIEDTNKFSTRNKIPYFDFNSYEGKYSPLLYF